MMKSRQETGFPLELLAQLLFSEERLFQGHDRVQALIDCLVHRTHAALSELSHNAISSL
jgi:hypothetical protein